MATTLKQPLASDPVRTLDSLRPTAAKAGLRSDEIGLNRTLGDAVVAFYGSVKEAAYALGEVDPSLMQREFKEGKFGRFNDHGSPEAKAHVARALFEAFAPLAASPAQRLRVLADRLREIEDEARQLADYVEVA